ncbi:hypothetical protein [Marasmitruncus massiliensis]|nr:hypothetical protein [Marasmitruncus massiliensis]
MFAITGGLCGETGFTRSDKADGEQKPLCAIPPPQTALPFAYAAIIA